MGSSKLLSLLLCVASADNANLRGAARVVGDSNFTDMTFETIDANLTKCGEAVLDFTEDDACHGRNADLAEVVDAAEMCSSTCKELSFRMLGACAVNSSIVELPEKLPAAFSAKPLSSNFTPRASRTCNICACRLQCYSGRVQFGQFVSTPCVLQ